MKRSSGYSSGTGKKGGHGVQDVHVDDEDSVTVRISLNLMRRGGRKLVIVPQGAEQWAPERPRIDGPLIRALARAFRWQRMLDCGRYASVSELATAERLDRSFVSHVLRLTLLAPDIVEAVLDGKQSPDLQLQPLIRGVPVEWEMQPGR